MNRREKLDILNKLYIEKKKVQNIMKNLKDDGAMSLKHEIASEISTYDNHPADIGDELNDVQKNMALYKNENSILNKINDAIEALDKGNYGICKMCNKPISKERLKFLPYADNCIECQKSLGNLYESKVLSDNTLLNIPSKVSYDGNEKILKDYEIDYSYKELERFNTLDNIKEFDDEDEDEGFVEEVEKISNTQYKSTL